MKRASHSNRPYLSAQSLQSIPMYNRASRRGILSYSFRQNRSSYPKRYFIDELPFVFAILINLSIKGERPSKEIDPADNFDHDILPILHCKQIYDIIYNLSYYIEIQNILMRNIAIVFKKNSKDFKSPLNIELKNSNNVPVRRSVDEFYHKLLQKQKQRQSMLETKNQIFERSSNQTSIRKRFKKKDQFNLRESINIQSVPAKMIDDKQQTTKSKVRISISRKSQSNKVLFKGFRIPNREQPDFSNNPPQKSSIFQHSKLKRLFKSRSEEDKCIVLVMSVNFIFNEMNFWEEEQIEEQATKYWKQLQSHAHIVWICERQETVKKLNRYCQVYGLRMDGVYLIVNRRYKKMLTVSYNLIQKQFDITLNRLSSPRLTHKRQRTMIVVNGLRVESTKKINENCLLNAIPVTKNMNSIVHLVKVDINDRSRFFSVIKILKQDKLPKPINVNEIVNSFYHKIKDHSISSVSRFDMEEPQNFDLLERMEELKNQYIRYFTRSLSLTLTDKIKTQNSENSMQFLIGDTLKRNYRTFKSYQNFVEQFQSKKQTLKKSALPFGKQDIFRKFRSFNLIYLWQL